MNRVFIVSAKRTAIGTFGGTLKDEKAAKLGAAVIKATYEEAKIKPENIDETIVGNILTAGQGMGPARQASIYSGIPIEVPAYTVNMICGSGMKTVMIGATDIKAGEADVVMAAGMESMSTSPQLLPYKGRFGNKFGSFEVKDHMIHDSLWDIFNEYHMGITAENIAEKYDISREEQDDLAYESQIRTIKAINEGKFKDEIIPYEIKTRKGIRTFLQDEHPRLDIERDKLSKLRPAFKKNGTVTAGNASGINDGASAILLASEEAVKKYSLKPMAEIIAFDQAGVDPAYMGLGPIPAIKKVLKKVNMSLKDMDLVELNEAFAAQALAVMREMSEEYGMTKEEILNITNVNGGAIALGHPVGCSGNRIIVTLLYEMKKRNSNYGLASLCIGGGMGTSIIIKNIK